VVAEVAGRDLLGDLALDGEAPLVGFAKAGAQPLADVFAPGDDAQLLGRVAQFVDEAFSGRSALREVTLHRAHHDAVELLGHPLQDLARRHDLLLHHRLDDVRRRLAAEKPLPREQLVHDHAEGEYVRRREDLFVAHALRGGIGELDPHVVGASIDVMGIGLGETKPV